MESVQLILLHASCRQIVRLVFLKKKPPAKTTEKQGKGLNTLAMHPAMLFTLMFAYFV